MKKKKNVKQKTPSSSPRFVVADESLPETPRSKNIHFFSSSLAWVWKAQVQKICVQEKKFSLFGTTQEKKALQQFVTKKNSPKNSVKDNTQTLLLEGEPAQEIVRFAAKKPKANLLFVGTHGHTGLKRMILGSVAEEVLQLTSIPTFVIGPQVKIPSPSSGDTSSNKWSPRKILVATDLLPHSKKLETLALEFAKHHHCEVRFCFSVFESLHPLLQTALASQRGGHELESVFEENCLSAHKKLEKLTRDFQKKGLSSSFVVLRSLVHASEAILEEQKLGADLVLMGTHSRKTGVYRMLGSTARALILSSAAPIVIVPNR